MPSYFQRVVRLPLSAAAFGHVARVLARKLPSLLPIGAVLIFSITVSGSASADEPMKPSSQVGATAPALDIIAQNTPGYSEAFPAGVPKTYSWCNGSYKPPGGGTPPPEFTAVTAVGSVYPKFGEPAYSNPDARIVVANARTYVHLHATKEWLIVQDQSAHEITGAHFEAKGSRASGAEMKIEAQADGVTAMDSPPPGRNIVLWMVKRGNYAAGSVDAVYVQMDIKTTNPKLKLVANVGAEWWRDPAAAYVQGQTNNRGAGNSNWVELSTRWSTLAFFSSTTAQFEANPPPPLVETDLGARPIRARRAPETPSPCLSIPAPR
ncbi:MAG: hypothetical protein HY852_24840 [Bradyrhizobium sp.]|uniref:hypothetical protein n=1 Tax=Bradyrhizobium sp. TaxID=376 RepID=UPI0025C61470|nr:hypothetical protein [Bradyrhizobium sp.]MBI5265034.1 hypothetical protein [Bradyrhizobium sp.]